MTWFEIKRKKGKFYLGTWGGLNFNLEFEFKRNSTTRVQTSNINSKLKRIDHAYELSSIFKVKLNT